MTSTKVSALKTILFDYFQLTLARTDIPLDQLYSFRCPLCNWAYFLRHEPYNDKVICPHCDKIHSIPELNLLNDLIGHYRPIDEHEETVVVRKREKQWKRILNAVS